MLRKNLSTSLEPRMRDRLSSIYADVREGLVDQYGLLGRQIELPETCPYEWEQIVARETNWIPNPLSESD
jgi:hypothetical protein